MKFKGDCMPAIALTFCYRMWSTVNVSKLWLNILDLYILQKQYKYH